MTIRYLTGITPSGVPHLGNYVGAIRPSVRSQSEDGVDHFYFLADLHSLIKSHDPLLTQRSTLEIAATWIACGLEPEKVTFYRQSDIPEILQLSWMLTCVTGKGLLNRAHAYKAAMDKNLALGADPDTDVTAGLFMYPVLMAADIMTFQAQRVPVGRDQVQHLEMARDMAASFNHLYANGQELLISAQAVVDENVATLPGLDGRKMSKSYGNTIPLFAPREQLRKLIMGITTDSRVPGEPKETEGSAIFQIYQSFASAQQSDALRQAFAQGIAWGEAKQQLFECIDNEISPMREEFAQLMSNPTQIEAILQQGAKKARAEAVPFLQQLRQAVGLRDVSSLLGSQTASFKSPTHSKATTAPPEIKQYRDTDGLFYFKLVQANGSLLLQSHGFVTGKEVGTAVSLLRTKGVQALEQLQSNLLPFSRNAQLEKALTQLLQAAQK